MKRYGRGWFGESTRHSLAARGMSQRRYAASKATSLATEPIFYARKRESELPFSHISAMVKQGNSYQEMKEMHPDADHEDMRLRAIKAIEMRDMDGTLSMIDKNGVDKTVMMVKKNPRLKEKVKDVLDCRQRGSFIAPVKKEAILKRIA